jgi:hypothetical protein
MEALKAVIFIYAVVAFVVGVSMGLEFFIYG